MKENYIFLGLALLFSGCSVSPTCVQPLPCKGDYNTKLAASAPAASNSKPPARLSVMAKQNEINGTLVFCKWHISDAQSDHDPFDTSHSARDSKLDADHYKPVYERPYSAERFLDKINECERIHLDSAPILSTPQDAVVCVNSSGFPLAAVIRARGSNCFQIVRNPQTDESGDFIVTSQMSIVHVKNAILLAELWRAQDDK